eukprot:11380852-Ditylum_brightwellii.AAC.1
MMQEQYEYLDTNSKLLLGFIQKIPTTITMHGNELQTIQLYTTGNNDGPNNKYQKHKNKVANVAEVMENTDALHSENRDVHAPDPGGVGVL